MPTLTAPSAPARVAVRSDGAADVGPLLPVVGAGAVVPLVTGGSAPHVALDNAASTAPLEAVLAAVIAATAWYGSVHRGAGFPSTVSSEAVEAARDDVRHFVGGRPDDVVVVTRNTTDALTLLARSLPADAVVFTLDIEHHANLLPWRLGRTVTVPTPRSVNDVAGAFDEALRRERPRRALIAVTGASNVTGEVLPISDIAAVARRHGARIVVDAAQLAPHRGIDLAAADIDWVAVSGHKLYAPFGAGALVGRRDWLDAAEPYLPGGGAVSNVGLGEAAWAASPARHEGGTPNVLGIVALAAACRELDAIGLAAVAAHEAALLAQLRDGLAGLAGVGVLSVFGDESDRVGIVTLAVDDPAGVAAALSAEHGISTRDGAFCAHPLLRRLFGVSDDAAVPNGLRASLGVGSSTADVQQFVDALRSVLAAGPHWHYVDDRGRRVPQPDLRPRPAGFAAGVTTAPTIESAIERTP